MTDENKRETPRVDAVAYHPDGWMDKAVPYQLARTLERELGDAIEALNDKQRIAKDIDRVLSAPHEPAERPALIDVLKQAEMVMAELAQEREAVKQLRDAYDLMQHKVIACGVIAEGNGDCNPIYQPGGQWDSQQAEKVRTLVSQLSAARAALEEIAELQHGQSMQHIAKRAIEQIGGEPKTQ